VFIGVIRAITAPSNNFTPMLINIFYILHQTLSIPRLIVVEWILLPFSR